MKIQVVKRPEIIIAGPLAITPEADSTIIRRLWEDYENLSEGIRHKGADVGYELHISEEGKHFCLTGMEVAKVEGLPLGCFAKTIPAGEYAVCTHMFSQGGFSKAYEQINQWLKKNIAQPGGFDHLEVQVYDHRFKGMDNPESEIDFLIPLFKI